MKRYTLEIILYIDAESEDEVWQALLDTDLHTNLNRLDAEGRYESTISDYTELPTTKE